MVYLKNKKLFLNFFFAILKCILNLKHLPEKRKIALIGDVFSEIPAPKKTVRSMSIKPRFRGLLEKEHRKWAKTFLQSKWQHL